MALASWMTLQSTVPFLMLQTGMSIAFKSSGILKVLCKVRPQVNSVAAIPLDAVANVILTSDLILARIRLIKKVLPVPPGASKNNTSPSFPSTMEQKQSYPFCWSAVSKAALRST